MKSFAISVTSLLIGLAQYLTSQVNEYAFHNTSKSNMVKQEVLKEKDDPSLLSKNRLSYLKN